MTLDLLSQAMLTAGFGHLRDKDNEHAKILGEVGNVDEGDGTRVTLLPHYLLVEAAGEQESGELWLPLTTLLGLIAEVQAHVAN